MAQTFTTDGTLPDVKLKMGSGVAGDIVLLPSGTFPWGSGANSLSIGAGLTLSGAGSGTWIIATSDSPSSTNGLIVFNGTGGTATSFMITPPNGKSTFTANSHWFRVTDITYNPTRGGNNSYFVFTNQVYGLIDNNVVHGADGENELIFGRGPTNTWNTRYVGGTKSGVYIENNIFDGTGYVCDANSNAVYIVRYNQIRKDMKIDGHGLNTNSPARSCRAMEIYNNLWTYTAGSSWPAVEFRGGVGYIFNNDVTGSNSIRGYYRLTDYAVDAPGSIFGGIYQTPCNYPIPDQVGAGPGATGSQVGGGQPVMFFNNVKGGALASLSWDAITSYTSRYAPTGGYASGTDLIYVTGGAGTDVDDGNYIKFSGDNQFYLITSGISSQSGYIRIEPPLQTDMPAQRVSGLMGAIINYRAQTGDPSGVFRMGPNHPCIIRNERDYRQTVANFDGQSGIGSGSYAQMLAITPTTSGVGYWVTGVGAWNKIDPSQNGQLYVWDSTQWALDYEPYQYPYLWSEGGSGISPSLVYKRLGRYLKFKGLAPV